MRWNNRTVILRSDHHYGQRVPAQALGHVLETIPDSVRHSVRMAIEGRSRARGKRPDWLRAATDIRFLGHDGSDETVLHFEAPSLGDAAPDLYEQKEFWATKPEPTDTAFDVLAKVITDVSARNTDSERFDRALLEKLTDFHSSLDRDFTSIEIISRTSTGIAIVNPSMIEIARTLDRNTPQPQRVRITGKLDMLRSSTQSFGVILDNGEEIRGVLTSGDITRISSLLEQRVMVLGKAVYRPSGKLLRIDADDVLESGQQDSFFSIIPKPILTNYDVRDTSRDQPKKLGLISVIGRWPGNETDEEIEIALDEMS